MTVIPQNLWLCACVKHAGDGVKAERCSGNGL